MTKNGLSPYLAVCILVSFIPGHSDAALPEVNTTSGLVIGTTHPESHSFYSIPYARAPVKELRFQPPVPVAYAVKKLNLSVPTYRKCFGYWQNCSSDNDCDQNYSEDCLNLDISVPSSIDLATTSTKLPVMFWIYGGAFNYGSGTDLIYDSRLLANVTNTIVVNINYRLNALGFLVYEENEVSFEGNQGIKDQQLALQWVNDNIENFGGDKNKVTIFGESAGGHSVIMHLMSAKSRPLYKRAIIQSYLAAINYENKAQATLKTDALLKAINCTDNKIQCLRNASAVTLMKAHPSVVREQTVTYFDIAQPYRPILDGVEFTQPPLDFFKSGAWKMDKELIIGTTSDERAQIKVLFENRTMTKQMFIEKNVYHAGPYYGRLAAEHYMQFVEDLDKPNHDFSNLFAQELVDMIFTCPNRALTRFILDTASTDKLPVYLYVFDFPVSANNCEEIYGSRAAVFCHYPTHAAELPYVFNSGKATGLNLTENGTKVANIMNSFWGHFAHNGEPAMDSSVWPPYQRVPTESSVNPWTNIVITAPTSYITEKYRSDFCDFWDDLGFYVNFTSLLTSSYIPTSANFGPTGKSTILSASMATICLSFLIVLWRF